MTYPASIDSSGANPDVSREVMSRLAAQVLVMGQQRFEQILQQPAEEEDYDYDDVEEESGEEE
jgi:hypothetical protein